GASSNGAFMALLSGLTAILGLDPVQRLVGLKVVDTDTGDIIRQTMTGDQIGLFTVALTIVVFVLGSFIFPDKPKTIEPAAA
ncbi:MAG: hypothetical protein HOH33_11465, partial [Verrucomicrobia bacterium]|nr:hypothetical protein [Verrucomicrobiota bacterium]